MPTLVDEAICIRHWDFSETSQTVSLFARSSGILRGLAKGAKRAGGRFSGGIDLLSRGQVVAIVKPGRELATLTDWTLRGEWRRLRSDLDANRAGYYAVDLIQRLLAPADPHPALYDTLVACLDAIEEALPVEPVALVYQAQFLSAIGVAPRWDAGPTSSATLFFSPSAGGLVGQSGGDAWKVRRATVELLAAIAGADRPEAFAIAIAAEPDVRDRANRLLAAYLRHTLGVEPLSMRTLFPSR